MSVPSIALKTSARNYAGLVNLGSRAVSSLTGNSSFTTPVPALSVVTTQVNDVQLAIGLWGPKGNRGSHDALQDLRNKAVTLHQTLKQLAQYVESTASIAAGSDYAAMAAIITSSGFELKNARNPQGTLQMVQNFRQFASRKLNVNQAKIRWKKPLNTTSAGNVKSYKVYRGTTNVFNTAGIVATVTSTSHLDTNLTSSNVTWYYWVVAVNNAGDGALSSPVMITVQGAP